MAYAVSDEMKIIDFGWPWSSLTTNSLQPAILATDELLVLVELIDLIFGVNSKLSVG